MGKSDTWENGLLLLQFNNVDFTGVGDGGGLRGSAVAGNYYFSLHTADPGDGGNQGTSEATYPGYARVAVPRIAAGFTVTGGSVANAAAILFPTCTSGGPQTITHIGMGTASSGAGKLKYSGALGSSLIVNPNIAPNFAIGALTVTED